MLTQAAQSAISGVLYAEDFDQPLLSMLAAGPPAPREPELIVPHFSLDELRAAAEQAHEEGRNAERRAAEVSIATRRDAALGKIAEQIAIVQEQSVTQIDGALDALARTMFSLFAAALPALCATHAQTELQALLHRILPPARLLPELHVRIHPSVREAIETDVEALLEGSSTHVTWIGSKRLLPGDISISWKSGAVLRDTATICNEIGNAVLAMFGKKEEIVEVESDDGQ